MVLCNMLNLMRSCSSHVSCFGVGAVVSNWLMGQIVMKGSNGSGRLCSLFSVVRLHA